MKRFAVVLLSVLLVLLPGCTKPVTESGVQSTESGTAESTAEALSSTESGGGEYCRKGRAYYADVILRRDGGHRCVCAGINAAAKFAGDARYGAGNRL